MKGQLTGLRIWRDNITLQNYYLRFILREAGINTDKDASQINKVEVKDEGNHTTCGNRSRIYKAFYFV